MDPLVAAMRAQMQNRATFHAANTSQPQMLHTLGATQMAFQTMQPNILPSSALPLQAQAQASLLLLQAQAAVRQHAAFGTPLLQVPQFVQPPSVAAAAAVSPAPTSVASTTAEANSVGVGTGGEKVQEAAVSLQDERERMQKAKDVMAKEEEAKKAEADKQRCHLHKKPKKGCKRCERHQDLETKIEEEKMVQRDKILEGVVKGRGPEKSEPKDMRRPLELANPKTFGFPPLLQTHIAESTHFKTCAELESFDDVIDEIFNYGETVEPYVQNSGTTPSALFCCVYRFLTMQIDGQSLKRLIEYEGNPYVRCAGFLFVRFALAPDQFLSWFGEYLVDDEELRPSKDSTEAMTIGEYVEALLTQDRYYTAILPRLPVSTKRQLEVHLAQVSQVRKRTEANRRLFDVYRERGVRIEACMQDGTWLPGESVELIEIPSRPKLRCRLEDGPENIVVHLGKIILADERFSSAAGSHKTSRGRRSRSRSPNVDWSREKGKTGTVLVEELRRREQDRAVCSTKGEYARRPVSFKVAMPVDQGAASHRLAQDETAVNISKRREERERSRSPMQDRKEHSAEYKANQRRVFEKYGMQKGTEASKAQNDIEGPDTLRLG